MPKTLFIAGARRNAGKTLVSELLLRALPGAGAIKVTCCRGEGGCPRDNPCGVCAALNAPFAVIQDPKIVAQPGKDTARLQQAAGSGKVVWLQSREQALGEGLDQALSCFADTQLVVVEGNAAFGARQPDLGLLVIGSGAAPAKSSVQAALSAVSGVVRNLRPGRPAPELVAGLRGDVRVFSFDAAHPGSDSQARSLVSWVREELGIAEVAFL